VIGSLRQVILRRRAWLKRMAKDKVPEQYDKISML
jgi:hypothetical protein